LTLGAQTRAHARILIWLPLNDRLAPPQKSQARKRHPHQRRFCRTGLKVKVFLDTQGPTVYTFSKPVL
jgi:hypothetical protein